MKSKIPKSSISAETIDEASRWFVECRLGELDNEARERFIEWLRASPANIRAYLEVAGTYAEMAPSNTTQAKLDLEKLIAEARAEVDVVELPRMRNPPGSVPRPRAGRLRKSALWGLAASALLAFGGGYYWYDQVRDTYQTQVGEQRSLTLSDGSRVDLNARSKVRIRLGPRERLIELVSGQALFHVTRDAKRPFVVRAETVTIRAIGTSFDVNRGRSGTTVTVIEGRVAVAPAGERTREPYNAIEPVLLSAGHQLRVSADATSVPTRVNAKVATAWTQHQLVFEDTPLQDVIEQFNRYNARQIVIDDRELDVFHVSGYYATANPTSLLNFLRTEPEIEVIESEDSIHIARK